MARKEKYNTHIKPYIKDITKWIREGIPEYAIYKKLGVDDNTFVKYKNTKKELKEAIIKGQQQLKLHIKSMLFKRCSGYTYTETKTYISKNGNKEIKRIEKTEKQVNPSDTAIIFALKNLDPENWKDRQEFKGDINQTLQNVIIDLEDDEG